MNSRWLPRNEAAKLIGVSPHTLRRYRERGEWLEGVHYSKLAQNCIVYNERLILDWVANKHNPLAHKLAIQAYLSELSELSEHGKEASAKRKRHHKAAG